MMQAAPFVFFLALLMRLQAAEVVDGGQLDRNRIIRSEDAQAQEAALDATTGAPANAVDPANTTTTPRPASAMSLPQQKPYVKDQPNFVNCGSLNYVTECNGTASNPMPPVCVKIVDEVVCFTGMCVCTDSGGCGEPKCTADSCNSADAERCADGKTCMSAPGTGWSCWHPCNFNHLVSDYGQANGYDVEYIRKQGACGMWDPTIAAEAGRSTLNMELKYADGVRPWSGVVTVDPADPPSGSMRGSLHLGSAIITLCVCLGFLSP